MTHLKSKEDIAWLFEVHLPHVSPFPAVCAVLEGNEDCPNRILLYQKNDWQCVPTVFKLSETGVMELELPDLPSDFSVSEETRQLSRSIQEYEKATKGLNLGNYSQVP